MDAERKTNDLNDDHLANEHEDLVLQVANRVYELMCRAIRLEKARGVLSKGDRGCPL